MASAGDIATVRQYTGNLENADPFTDEFIGLLIDASGVASAVAHIWERLSVQYSTLVDVTEAGATHKFSDLFKNAVAMRDYWATKAANAANPAVEGRVVVRKIVRL